MSYFNTERKQKALECIRTFYECAEEVGIRDALFVNFGLLLGIIREGDFIAHDHDVDMCVKQDMITPEQELRYFLLLKKRGMFFARRRWSFKEDAAGFMSQRVFVEEGDVTEEPLPVVEADRRVRFTWFTLRKRKGYPRFCHWFFFNHDRYAWHTKAGRWLTKSKFDPVVWQYDANKDVAIMKGCPQEYVEELLRIKFYGLEIQIPAAYGSLLDFLYPGWRIPRKGGASAKKIVCVVGNWEDRSTWRIKMK